MAAISSALRQTVEVEVLVMEDAGADGSGEAVRSTFPQVRYHRSETSRGPTWQRNEGARLARAPFLVTLDDDCELVSPECLAQCLAQFDQERIAAVTIPYVNVRQDDVVRSVAPDRHECWITLGYMGGMVAFRREDYLSVGGYRTEYFMQVEESDLAIRLLGVGKVVRLGTADPMHHHESPVRDDRRRYVLGARNHVLFAWFNVPAGHLVQHLGGTTLKHIVFGLRQRHPRPVTEGLLRGWLDGPLSRSGRAPVTGDVYRLSRRLRREGALRLSEAEPYLVAR